MCGWLQAISGLKVLLKETLTRHQFQFILTGRFNQDALEVLFCLLYATSSISCGLHTLIGVHFPGIYFVVVAMLSLETCIRSRVYCGCIMKPTFASFQNFFGVIRGQNGFNEHPSAATFRSTLRMTAACQIIKTGSHHGNCAILDENSLMSMMDALRELLNMSFSIMTVRRI